MREIGRRENSGRDISSLSRYDLTVWKADYGSVLPTDRSSRENINLGLAEKNNSVCLIAVIRGNNREERGGEYTAWSRASTEG